MIKANEIEPNKELLDKLFLKRMKKIEKSIMHQNKRGRTWVYSFLDIRIENRVVKSLEEMGYTIELQRFSNGSPYLYIEW
jgi:hypothetical protein